MKVRFFTSSSGAQPVQRFIRHLPAEDRARFVDLIVGLEAHGLEYDRATFRQLQGKLWEIRFNAPGGSYRIAYVIVEQDEMMFLHVFKKQSRRTPHQDLALALARMKEVLK